MKPFFSIITCTLNSEKFLRRNLDSVKKQTFIDYEHVFVDGYSDDATVDIINSYRLEKPEKIKLYHLRQKGISSAMNRGIHVSNGEYVIILHSDDRFHDKYVLARVYRFLKNNNFPDWIYGKIQVFDEDCKKIGTFPNQRIFQVCNLSLLKMLNYIPHQSVFINRRIFSRFGYFDEKLVSSMDYDLWLRLSNNSRWVFIDRIISNYSIGKQAQSSARKNKKINDFQELKVVHNYLNRAEYLMHRIVKFFLDIYNHALYK
jgi:glycosyltransferase involved in cell wall biosynthesis